MLLAAYVCLGLAVGVLTGVASSPIANTVLASIFSFAGGTAAAVLALNKIDRRIVSIVLSGFSIGCLCGVLLGIAVKENRLLTDLPRVAAIRKLETLPGDQKLAPLADYLKGNTLTRLQAINTQYRNNDLRCSAAYDQLWAAVQEP
jgi:hypothetical protein